MICKNCGAEMKDNALICEACQTAVTPDPPVEEANVNKTAPVEEAAVPLESQQPPKKPKGKKIALVAVAVVLVAALVAALLPWNVLANSIRKMTMSPADYLSYVHTQPLASFGKKTGALLTAQPQDRSAALDLSLSLGEGAKKLLSTMGVTLDTLPGISLSSTVTTKTQNDALSLGYDALVKLNGKDWLSLASVIDYENDTVTLRIPQLHDKALKLELAKPEEESEELARILENLSDVLPDEASLARLFEKYAALFLAQFKDVKAEEGSLHVDAVKQNCSVYTATFDGESMQKAAESILEALKNDSQIQEILRNVSELEESKIDFDTLWSEYQTGIDRLLEAVKEDPLAKDAFSVTYTAYVDGTGRLIGGQLKGRDFTLKAATAFANDKFAQEYSFTHQPTAISLSFQGNGTLTGGKLNGEYTLKTTGVDLLAVTLADFDAAAAAQGRLNGTATVKLGQLFTAMTAASANGAANPLADLSLQIKFAAPNAREASQEWTLSSAEGTLLTLTLSDKLQDPASLPAFEQVVDGSDTQALLTWAQEAAQKLPTPQSFFQSLGLSEDLANALGELMENGGANNAPSLDADDSFDDWDDDWDESFDDWDDSTDDWEF